MRVLTITDFKVKSNLNALDKVIDRFNQIDKTTIPKKDWLQCQLALVEGFTNAVRHAHKNLPDELEIEVCVTFGVGCMEIRIWDWGPPFDLQSYIDRIPEKQQNNWSEGGRGIPILHKIADRLNYFRAEDDRNCLLIVKHFCPIQQNLTDERN